MDPSQVQEINQAASFGYAYITLGILIFCSIGSLLMLAFNSKPEDVNPNNHGDVW